MKDRRTVTFQLERDIGVKVFASLAIYMHQCDKTHLIYMHIKLG